MNQSACFILHYKKNIERRNYIFDHFVSGDKTIHWITDFDREEIADCINNFYQFDQHTWRKIVGRQLPILLGHRLGINPQNRNTAWPILFTHAEEIITRTGTEKLIQELPQYAPRQLKIHEISILLKHRAAYEKIVRENYKFGVILEDDFLLKNNWSTSLENFINHDAPAWDFVDIAGGAGLSPREQDEEVFPGFYSIVPPRTRTACGYLISNRLCREITRLKMPLTVPCDWELTYYLLQFHARAFWTNPPILIHGSETNFYKSNNE